MNEKQLIAEKAVDFIKDGMIVGLGTGSTAYWAITKIGELVRNGMNIKGVPTSINTEKLAQNLNIPLVNISEIKKIDITIDGADEFDENKNVIKGGGGALLREKIIASITNYYIIIADSSKKVEVLGNFPLPIEVTPFAHEITIYQLKQLGCSTNLRLENDKPFITDNKNFIVDCKFNRINKPEELANKLNSIPGVVEHGLFSNMADILVTVNNCGEISIIE
ncbi:ribose-5-phosphate isomerase RpiA [Maledivibacter halophilus]|uniref:Ribose-5-phosphate isomerase A n=1 Tax=Maledivibacter halophilus TaxID=36842 RepID=A0A1T5M1G5_9FIRM|nr:ribose-5-phosphate isomerase RpiA [Maledivibacter halophilus]SKC81864.1 ribose-5-phosphate isomerase [Maledivibacter halophilus]